MAPGQDATEFNKIIQADRNKKQKQALADKIFSRRSSAPAPGAIGSRKPPAGPSSLAHRITKPGQASKAASRTGTPVARVQNATASLKRSSSTPQLGNTRRNQALDAAVNGRGTRTPGINDHISIRSKAVESSGGGGPGFSIKGSASQPRDYIVVAQNFAPGTTAEDISSVFVPNADVAGLVACRLLVSSPTVIAELIFDNQNAAEDVVNMYNGKKADNRVLYVYHSDAAPKAQAIPRQPRAHGLANRIGNPKPAGSSEGMDVDVPRPRYQETYTPPRPRRAQPDVQDGRYGFNDNNVFPSQAAAGSQTRLVSDGMIGRGRGGNARGGNGVGRLFH